MRDFRVLQWKLLYGSVALLAIGIYLPTLKGLFVWDDIFLVNGSGIGGGQSLWNCFSRPFLANYYRPLGSASFFVENRLWQKNPFFYHQTNIALHALTTGLVIALLLTVTGNRWAAFWGGLIYAVHPAQVSAVAFIGGRVDVLGGFWMTLFALALARAIQGNGAQRYGYACLAALAYTGAIFTKEQMLALLPLVPFACACFRGGQAWSRRERGLLLLPFALVSVLYVLLWLHIAPPPRAGSGQPPGDAIQTVGLTIVYYARILLLPSWTGLHSFSLGTLDQAGVAIAAAGYGLLAGACGLALVWYRRNRPACWLLAWSLLCLAPVLNIVPSPSLPVAPYRAALAAAGCSSLLGWGLAALLSFGVSRARSASTRLPLLAVVLSGGLLILYGARLTVRASESWKEEAALYARLAQADPYCIMPRVNYAGILLERGRGAEAVRMLEANLQRVIESGAWRDFGTLEAALNRDRRIAVRLLRCGGNPGEPKKLLLRVYSQLGTLYLNTGQPDRAFHILHIAERLLPGNRTVRAGLGSSEFERQRYAPAERWLLLALESDPGFSYARWMLGRAYAARKRWPEAEREFQRCLRDKPPCADAYLPLAEVLLRQNKREAARQTLLAARQHPLLAVEAGKRLEQMGHSAAVPSR